MKYNRYEIKQTPVLTGDNDEREGEMKVDRE